MPPTTAPGKARSGSETRQMQATVITRMLPAERERIVAAARQRSISVSELVRSAVLREIHVA